MKVKEGDVLVCDCEDCDLRLVVVQGCSKQSSGCGCDGDGADISVICCDKPMVLEEKKGGCCCCGD